MSRIILILAVLLAFSGIGSGVSVAQGRGMVLIRDAEIEHIIRDFSTPLFQAAGLNPDSIQIHLIRDATLNAFVSGGQNIFINTGLIMRAESPNQLIGVIAHETGHIAGGHLIKLQDAVSGLSTTSILAVVLGAAAMVAGQGDVGGAIIAGGQQMAERNFLQFTRTQESAADQAALTFLGQTGQSARGYLDFLEILGDQEALLTGNQDPYVRTHPISRERLSMLRDRVSKSGQTGGADSPANIVAFARVKAKLFAFLEPPDKTYRQYPLSDGSFAARYARAIALYRTPDISKALAAIDQLIAGAPRDPFLAELKGQMLMENGRVVEAVPSYRTATELRPDSALILLALGQAELATNDQTLVKEAIARLEAASRIEPRNAGIWHQLAIGYERDGRSGMAALASAEAAIVRGRPEDARMFSQRAQKLLPTGSPGWLRAQDVEGQAEKDRDRARRERQP